MSIPDIFVSHGLDIIDLLLPQLQLSHETLNNPNKTVHVCSFKYFTQTSFTKSKGLELYKI